MKKISLYTSQQIHKILICLTETFSITKYFTLTSMKTKAPLIEMYFSDSEPQNANIFVQNIFF